MSDHLYVGFNRRVSALDPETGDLIWKWKAPKGTGYVSLLFDRGVLYAAVHGHIYALDPLDGRELWSNPMAGFGYGVTCLATVRGSSGSGLLAEAAASAARQATASGGGTGSS